jgi:hypothetical protein
MVKTSNKPLILRTNYDTIFLFLRTLNNISGIKKIPDFRKK